MGNLLIIPFMIFFAAIAVMLLALPLSLTVMVLLGIAHSFNPVVPALGYWTVYFLVLALRLTVLPISLKTSK